MFQWLLLFICSCKLQWCLVFGTSLTRRTGCLNKNHPSHILLNITGIPKCVYIGNMHACRNPPLKIASTWSNLGGAATTRNSLGIRGNLQGVAAAVAVPVLCAWVTIFVRCTFSISTHWKSHIEHKEIRKKYCQCKDVFQSLNPVCTFLILAH